jgi:cysteine desulfurase/selenocysteine lyase
MESEFAVEELRKLFPIFGKCLGGGRELIYFDNSATTHKPQCVINALVDFYATYNANVHRGTYEHGEMATNGYEGAREKVAAYFGVKNSAEIIFLRGATEAINLVANSYGRKFLLPGDEILVGAAEHHSNYLPWQALEREIGVVRKIIALNSDGDIDLERYAAMFSKRTKFVAVQHIGNVTGAVNDVQLLAEIAHGHGAKILIDGACSMAFHRVDLSRMDCDFFACSGHKGFGPMGSGFLYGKYDLLNTMAPYQSGGNMVNRVRFGETSFKLPPHRFEAGTPDVAAAIGLGCAIDFLGGMDWNLANAHCAALRDYLSEKLLQMDGVQIYGNPKNRMCIFPFNLKGVHCHDVATFLGIAGIAVRAGTHCAQPLMDLWGIPGCVRMSLCFYNTKLEIDSAVEVLGKCGLILR